MRNPITRKGALFAAGGFVAALFIAGAAHAVTDTIFRYSTPHNGYFSIDRMAMTPVDTDAAQNFSIEIGNGQGLRATGPQCFNSAVNLPQHAAIVKMTVWYSSVAEGDPDFFVLRQRLTDGHTDVVIMSTGADDSGQRKTLNANADMNFADVDNAHYSYGFGACLAQLDKLYAARIQYTYNTAGD
jgi:hypothetical protein